jgi:cytochrome c553
MMAPMAAALSGADIENLAVYYSRVQPGHMGNTLYPKAECDINYSCYLP